MATIEKEHLAGATIRLTVTLPKTVAEYDDVFVNLYTNEQKQFKFHVGEKTGYYLAYLGSAANKIKVVLKGKDMTAKMSGKLMFEVKTVETIDDEITIEEHGGKKYTGIIITNFLLKNDI